jgi:hypothetical protein
VGRLPIDQENIDDGILEHVLDASRSTRSVARTHHRLIRYACRRVQYRGMIRRQRRRTVRRKIESSRLAADQRPAA